MLKDLDRKTNFLSLLLAASTLCFIRGVYYLKMAQYSCLLSFLYALCLFVWAYLSFREDFSDLKKSIKTFRKAFFSITFLGLFGELAANYLAASYDKGEFNPLLFIAGMCFLFDVMLMLLLVNQFVWDIFKTNIKNPKDVEVANNIRTLILPLSDCCNKIELSQFLQSRNVTIGKAFHPAIYEGLRDGKPYLSLAVH